MIIADTSGLLAFFNKAEPRHRAVVAAVEGSASDLVVSPFVVAELDYLLATRVSPDVAIAVMEELAGGAYLLPHVDAGDLQVITGIMGGYRDLDIGVADASLLVLADRYDTVQILTLDRRHFGAMTSMRGAPLHLLPDVV